MGLTFKHYLKKFGRWIIILGVFTLYIQSTPLLAYRLNKYLELPKASEAQINQADAIVILGGGTKASTTSPNKLEPNASTLVRIHYAAYLAHKHPNKIIIASGGYISPTISEANAIKTTLIDNYGVTNKIIVEYRSRNTEENAKYTAQLIKNLGLKNILVVTQAYHSKRVLMLFRKYGVNATIAPTDYTYFEEASIPALAIQPSAKAILYTSRALHEYLGYLVYSVLPATH